MRLLSRRRRATRPPEIATPTPRADSPTRAISTPNPPVAPTDYDAEAFTEQPFDPSRPTFDLLTPRRRWEELVASEVAAGRARWPERRPVEGVDYLL
jgi:hypothetical protein